MTATPWQNDLVGLVLAGGKSARMGKAKAHLVFNGMPQWQYAEQVLRTVVDSVYFSVSPQLQPPLPIGRDLLIDDVFTEPIGPLGGIISAFHQFPQRAIFVLACDLPHFDEHAARYLCDRRNPEKLATVFTHDDLIEPLCAIYEPAIKAELAKFWANGIYCPRNCLKSLDVERITLADERWIVNVNHAHELTALSSDAVPQKVHVRYYASHRVQAGKAEESITTPKKTVGELYVELKNRYGFVEELVDLRFSRNNQMVLPEAELGDKDSIVFIPPVSGG